jgi:predicted outer membrane protein
MRLPRSVSRSNRVMLLGIPGIVAALVACSANQPPPAAPASSLARTAPERSGATMMQPSERAAAPAMVSESSAAAPVSDAQLASLDDAHLAAVIQAASNRATRIARVEESRGADRDVKRFAHELAASHADAESRFEEKLSQLGIEPASGPVSDQVRTEVESSGLAALRSAHGKDLDRAYVDQQLQELTGALTLVLRANGQISRPELRAAVDGLRARLERNAREARDIRDALVSGKTSWRPDAYDPDKVQR